MRRLYREQIRQYLGRGDLLGLARRAGRYAMVHLSYALGRPVTGPILGTLITNYSCNLRCLMCDLPLRVKRYGEEGLNPLSTPEMLAVIDDFSAIGTLGLGFTGGEPMLRKDIFELLERSRQKGMITHLNTNGTFVDDEAAARLVSIGVDSVNLSLDGATRETHDRIRAKEGSFQEVLDAAARILDRRGPGTSRIRLKLVFVLSRDNLHEAEQVLALREEIGADCVDFIPVHDFDAPGSTRSRPIVDPITPELASRLKELRDRLQDQLGRQPIDNSKEHLDLIPRALEGQPSPLRCYAGYNSLAVDGYGRIFPCVPWSNQDRPVGDVRKTSLRRFWKSRAYGVSRKEIRECTDCYLNCQTELNLLFNRKAASSRSGTA